MPLTFFRGVFARPLALWKLTMAVCLRVVVRVPVRMDRVILTMAFMAT